MKSQSYNTFWQRLHNSAKMKGFPLRVMFELTYRCNFKCKHCYVPLSYRKKGELKTKEVFFILDQLADIDCFYLGFTGGEPFVRKDTMKILWYAKKKGFEVIIYTNGSMIDEKTADELASLRPNKVDITIPAMSRNVFERISGVLGSRDKVFRTVNLLHKKGVSLGFKTCVLKENESEIKEIESFTYSLGALHRLDDMLSPRLDGSKEPFKYRAQRIEDRKQNKIEKSKLLDCQTMELSDCRYSPDTQQSNTINLFRCGVGQSQAAITPLGELKMCLMIDYPKYKITVHNRGDTMLQEMSLKDTWNKLGKLVSDIKPDKNYQCNKCKIESYCKWCPAKSWLHNRTFTRCAPESRKQAEYRYRIAIQMEVNNAREK